MKVLRVTKIVKKLKLEGVWDDLESKKDSRDSHRISEINSSFLVK